MSGPLYTGHCGRAEEHCALYAAYETLRAIASFLSTDLLTFLLTMCRLAESIAAGQDKRIIRRLITVAHFLWPIHIRKLQISAETRFARVWAVIGRMAYTHLMQPRSRLAGWRPPNWALNTMSCDGLRVRGAGSLKGDRWLSADAEAERMRTERPWGTRPVAAWLHQCPYAREPVACCGKRTPCWETVCSEEETANFELMRGFALAAHSTGDK